MSKAVLTGAILAVQDLTALYRQQNLYYRCRPLEDREVYWQWCEEGSPISDSPDTLCVLSLCVEHQDNDSQNWLQQHKLKSSLFALTNKAAVDHEGWQAAGHVAARGHEDVTIHLHLHSSWAAHVCQA